MKRFFHVDGWGMLCASIATVSLLGIVFLAGLVHHSFAATWSAMLGALAALGVSAIFWLFYSLFGCEPWKGATEPRAKEKGGAAVRRSRGCRSHRIILPGHVRVAKPALVPDPAPDPETAPLDSELDVIAALENLGYGRREARRAVRLSQPDKAPLWDFEMLFNRAIQQLKTPGCVR